MCDLAHGHLTNIDTFLCPTGVAYLDDEAAKVQLREDLEHYSHTLSIRYHGVVLSGYVEILHTHTHTHKFIVEGNVPVQYIMAKFTKYRTKQ